MRNVSPAEEERSFSFTLRGSRRLQETVIKLGDQGTDKQEVYRAARDQIRLIPFGDNLKRYIYLSSYYDLVNETGYNAGDGLTEGTEPEGFVNPVVHVLRD